LDALSKNGYTAEAFLMLMRTQIRSWLYQVEMGATTIWERWDAIKEGKKISSGSMSTGSEYQEDPSMLSFNHYAYGAVADWIYKNIAGVTPDDTNVGYRAFRFAPSVAKGFTFCRAKFQTGYGEIASNWELSPDGDLIAELKVPFGVTAKLELPKSSSIEIDGSIASNGASLTYGKHTIVAREVNLITY
jgi:alpha-L-rhamnosidase